MANKRNTHSDGRHDNKGNDELVRKVDKHVTTPEEYDVECIMRDIGKGPNARYVVWCYGYTSADDTIQPPNHIIQHYTPRFRVGYGEHENDEHRQNKMTETCASKKTRGE